MKGKGERKRTRGGKEWKDEMKMMMDEEWKIGRIKEEMGK